MAYDSPKAIHLQCRKDGAILPHNDHEGLRARWKVAARLRELNVNMLRLTLAERVAVAQAVAEENATMSAQGLSVQLAGDPQ
jgi:hypothetical protein